jgi:hypothetical protein
MLQGIIVVGTYTILVSTILYLTRDVEISRELLADIHNFQI